MFLSTTFRWTFATWTFFSVMATASVVLTLLSAILGVVCRLNFGKGLARYRRFLSYITLWKELKAKTVNSHQGSDGKYNYFSDGYADIEKVAFPSFGQPVPTYVGDIKPLYPQSFSPYGPQGIVTSPERWVAFPEAALQRNVADIQVYRNKNYGSARSLDRSHSSCQSDSSHSRNGSQTSHTSHTKRWVIE